MKSVKKDIQITIRLDTETHDNLKLLAAKERRNLTDYIRVKLEDIIAIEKMAYRVPDK